MVGFKNQQTSLEGNTGNVNPNKTINQPSTIEVQVIQERLWSKSTGVILPSGNQTWFAGKSPFEMEVSS